MKDAYLDDMSPMSPFLRELGSLDEIKEIFRMIDVDRSGVLEMKEFTDGMRRCKEDFNKFLLWQIWQSQNCALQKIDESTHNATASSPAPAPTPAPAPAPAPAPKPASSSSEA